MASMRLELALPEFAEELRSLLLVSKVPELAIQVSELIIARRCSCEDDFCATFYTEYEPTTIPYKNARCLVIME